MRKKKNQIMLTRKHLKNIIMGSETKFNSHIQEYLLVLDLVECTINTGESNSILLIGPRGSGKTTLIASVVKKLLCSKRIHENAMIVNLHGLIHTDDRLALKDTTRQMQLENVMGNKMFGTFAENFNFLIECLKSGDKRCSKPIIFTIDEFDLFCVHHNQTFLYNLFDITQSAQAPVCVIGITCRLDVIELLEKRVKSRFSHRQIFICGNSNLKVSKSAFDDRLNLFESLLSFPKHTNFNNTDQIDEYCYLDSEFRDQWNKHIKDLIYHSNIINILKQMYSNDRSERKFRNFLGIVVSNLCRNDQRFEVDDFNHASKIFLKSEKNLIMEGLSILEMCLVIAIKHETEIHDDDSLNFEKVWNRYLKFVNQNSSIETVQRPVVVKAFEHIKSLELIVPVGSNRKIEKEYHPYNSTVMSKQILEAMKNCQGLPTDVTQWAENSLF